MFENRGRATRAPLIAEKNVQIGAELMPSNSRQSRKAASQEQSQKDRLVRHNNFQFGDLRNAESKNRKDSVVPKLMNLQSRTRHNLLFQPLRNNNIINDRGGNSIVRLSTIGNKVKRGHSPKRGKAIARKGMLTNMITRRSVKITGNDNLLRGEYAKKKQDVIKQSRSLLRERNINGDENNPAAFEEDRNGDKEAALVPGFKEIRQLVMFRNKVVRDQKSNTRMELVNSKVLTTLLSGSRHSREQVIAIVHGFGLGSNKLRLNKSSFLKSDNIRIKGKDNSRARKKSIAIIGDKSSLRGGKLVERATNKLNHKK